MVVQLQDGLASISDVVSQSCMFFASSLLLVLFLDQLTNRFVTLFLTMLFLSSLFVLLIGAFIPLWILPSTFSALAAGAFCIQFGVQGAWGVVSIN